MRLSLLHSVKHDAIRLKTTKKYGDLKMQTTLIQIPSAQKKKNTSGQGDLISRND